MRTYTENEFRSRDFADVEKFNAEIQNWLSQYNGQLHGEQLPYEGFNLTKFHPGTNYDAAFDTKPDGSARSGVGQILTTQSYFQTKSAISSDSWSRSLASGGTVTLIGPPSVTFNSNDNSWQQGIVPLHKDIDDGVFMRVPTLNGSLVGFAQVDVEYYFVEKTIEGFSGNYGSGWRVQLYVYVDGRMVATTGPQPCGKRKSYALPFSIPINTKPNTEIDIRWSATFDGAGTGSNNSGAIDDAQILFFNSLLFCRNVYR